MPTRIFVLTLLLIVPIHLFAQRHALKELDPRLRQLQQCIKSINLINGLNLTVKQMKGLKELAHQSDNLQKAAIMEARRAEDEALTVLESFYEQLKKNVVPGRRTKHMVHRIEHPFKEVGAGFNEQMISKVEEAKKLLNPGQVAMVKNYRPCIVPTSDLTDPSRIGSAASEQMLQHFERIRNLSEQVYQHKKQDIINHHVRRMRLHFQGKIDVTKEGAEFGQFIDKIRALDDVEWQLNGQKMIEEAHEEKELLHRPGRKRDKTDAFIQMFLLNPDMYQVYAERIKAGGAPEQQLPEEEKKGPWQYRGWRRFRNLR